MSNDLGYGRQLSGEEYDRRVIELHRHASPMPDKEEDLAIRKQELNLSIDYRLGVDFPEQKREALWVIMQRVEKRRLWLGLKYGLRMLFSRNSIPKHLPEKANALAGFLVDECSSILNERERRSFFELGPGEKAALPLDKDNIGKK
ncbi:MAG: hypothetical protein KZQ99_01370 [Candidatus Thiodiazotropha sp. (ex Dulcina madagascariensis)]|nr:hypothetical protein [Candidatus Thiodiazotropha sp. (ex Dulcina madagascariensis)]